MGDVLKYPVRTGLLAQGVPCYKVSIDNVAGGCVVAGHVRFPDTDINEVAVYANDLAGVFDKQWLDHSARGEIVFMLCCNNLVQDVSIFQFAEWRRVVFMLETRGAASKADDENAATAEPPLLEWKGCAARPHETFTLFA